jgi:hypothetical protein
MSNPVNTMNFACAIFRFRRCSFKARGQLQRYTGSNPARAAKHKFPRESASIKDRQHPKPVPFRYAQSWDKSAQIGHFGMLLTTSCDNIAIQIGTNAALRLSQIQLPADRQPVQTLFNADFRLETLRAV